MTDATQNNQTSDNAPTSAPNQAMKSSFLSPSDSPQQDTSDTTTPNFESSSPPPPSETQPLDFSSSQSDSVTGAGDTPNQGRSKAIATILGVVMLVVGVAAGVLLVNNNAEVRIKAWDCVNYVFEVSEDGVVSVRNGSTRNEPLQKAQVKINGEVVATLDVPALNAGDAATLGTVPVPPSGFSWEVFGTKDCENTGTYGDQTPTPTTTQVQARCGEVVAYDSDWNQLSSTQLSQLSVGDVVRFAVNGTATSGTFEKARFTINGVVQAEVTEKRPGTDDFYDEYTIPNSIVDFTVEAEIMHSELGWM